MKCLTNGDLLARMKAEQPSRPKTLAKPGPRTSKSEYEGVTKTGGKLRVVFLKADRIMSMKLKERRMKERQICQCSLSSATGASGLATDVLKKVAVEFIFGNVQLSELFDLRDRLLDEALKATTINKKPARAIASASSPEEEESKEDAEEELDGTEDEENDPGMGSEDGEGAEE